MGPSPAASTSGGSSLPATEGSRTFQGRSLMQRVGPAWLCVPTGAAGPLGAAPGRGLAGVRLAGGFSAGLTGSWASATFPSMGRSSGACVGSHRTGLRRRSCRPVCRQGVPDALCERHNRARGASVVASGLQVAFR